jgi:glycosyltransferase involved in cell wall biosynthesis
MTPPDGPADKGHLCILRHSYYPAELNVRREAEALLEDGYRVHVICLRGPGEARRENIGGVDVRRLPVGHQRGRIGRYLFEYNAFFLLASFELFRLHASCRLRAVQVNTMPDYLVFATLIPKLTGAKVVLHLHEPMPELFATLFPRWYYRALIGAIRLAERASLAYADHALTVTREMRANFGRRGADVDKITVIVNVPDERLFRLDRHRSLAERVRALKEEEHRTGVFRVLCHGAIEERYGLELIVRAIARLKEEIPGIQFRFMGQGEDVDRLLALAHALRAESHVAYLGFVPFETMLEELLAADVAVVPMRRNPYSELVHTNKMYEYVALGRPVVASRLASVAAYFPENTLLYFEPGDAADLATQLRYAYRHPEAMRERIRATTAVYEAYRWEREKRNYLAVYDVLLGSGDRRCSAAEAAVGTISSASP